DADSAAVAAYRLSDVRHAWPALPGGLAKTDIFEIVVVHAEEVPDFVHQRRFHFLFDFFQRVTFVFDGALENENVIGIERLGKIPTLRERDAFVESEQRIVRLQTQSPGKFV